MTRLLRHRALMALGLTVLLTGSAALLRRVADPVPSDGSVWESTAEGLVVRAANDPLAVGDRLASIDGAPISGMLDLLLVDRAGRPGALRKYEVARGGGYTALQVPVIRGRVPVVYLLLALVGIIALGVGTRLTFAARAQPGARLAATAAFLFALLALASPAGWMDSWDRVVLALDEGARLVFPPVFLHALLMLWGAKLRRRAILLYGPAVLLGLADVTYFSGLARRLGFSVERLGATLDGLVACQLFVCITAAAVVALDAFRRSRGVDRLRKRWAVLAALGGFAPYGIAVAAPMALGLPMGRLGADLSLLGLVLVPLALANAFLGRPLRPSALARSGLRLAAGTLVAVGIAVAAGAVLGGALAAAGLPTWAGYALVGAVVVAGSFERTRRAVEDAVERSIDREAYEAKRELVALGREIAAGMSCNERAGVLVSTIARATRTGDVLLFERRDQELHLTGRCGETASARERLAIADLAYLDLGSGRPVVAGGVGGPFGSAVGLIVPLVARGRLAGMLALGEREQGPLGRSEINLLADLSGYVAVALENARLYGEVVRHADAIRELEEFRANVIESLEVGILILDLNGRVLSSNLAFRQLAGTARLDAGSQAGSVLPAVFLDPPLEGQEACRSMGDRTIAVATSLLRRTDGSVQGRILTAEDVTERVAEERNRNRREKLASLGVLSAGIAHEVNTPLAGISSYVQMLLESTPPGDPRRPFLEKVDKQSFRASRMVRNLLNFARAENDPAAAVDLNRVIADSLSLVEHEVKQAGVLPRLTLDVSLRPVTGRATELEQVVVNLLRNAIDAMKGRGGELRIETSAGSAASTLRITDTGEGIADADLGRVLEPFFTTKERGQGSGLGLAISRSIVEAHGGEIRVASQRGVGTTMTVVLPAEPSRVPSKTGGGGGAT